MDKHCVMRAWHPMFESQSLNGPQFLGPLRTRDVAYSQVMLINRLFAEEEERGGERHSRKKNGTNR